MTQRLQRRFGAWIVHHAFEFKWFYLGAFTCLYVLQVLQSEIPSRIRDLTEHMSTERISTASVWVFVGLAFGILVFRTCSRLLFFYPARVQQKFLREELLAKLEASPPSRYSKWNQGQIFQILFDDINNLRAFIGFGLLQVGNLIIAAWVLIPKLNNDHDSYLWPAFIPLFLSVIFFSMVSFINQKIFKKMMDKKGEVQQFIIEAYEAKQTIKNFHREENFINRFVKVSSEELSLFFKSSIGFAITGPYVKLGLGASLLWGAILIRAHNGGPSDLVFFSGFLYLFLEPVMFLSWVAIVLSQGLAAWKRVKELTSLLEMSSVQEKTLSDVKFERKEKSIELESPFWNKIIHLKFSTNCWSVIVGETGSGKSFLLSSLASIMVMRNLKVSMVQQEPYLFNDTIADNIFLGKEVTENILKDAKELLTIFQLDSLAPSLDEVLSLEVGENGKRLSGGQIKRVALVRSLMSGADVLVWDDPFSSVDIILERKIIKTLKSDPSWGKLTFVISSHRLTTVKLCDEMIFIDRDLGIKNQGTVERILKEEHVGQFFKEQMVELPLA